MLGAIVQQEKSGYNGIVLQQSFYNTQNVICTVDEIGNVTDKYKYSPYGMLLSNSKFMTQNPLQFSSEYYDDETQLIYFNYRYYNPALGRWLSPDPIGILGGVNLYTYVSNNPINKYDILGYAPATVAPFDFVDSNDKSGRTPKNIAGFIVKTTG